MYDLMSSDHAFESFLATAGDRFEGDEAVMFKYFRAHPGREEDAAIASALRAYAKGKK